LEVQYVEQVFYIALSQLLFYIAQTWREIAVTSIAIIATFAVAGVLLHKRRCHDTQRTEATNPSLSHCDRHAWT
jgi:hypothetical protein